MNNKKHISVSSLAKLCLVSVLMSSANFMNTVKAQYVGVDLKLKQERMMETLLPFAFQSPLKQTTIKKGAEKERFLGKGIYAIGANENVRVLVNLSYTDKLIDKKRNKLPFEIIMSYVNDGTKEEKSSLQVEGKAVDFMLNNAGHHIEKNEKTGYVVRAYVFLNGRLKTSEDYTYPLKGEINLTVEYE